MNINGVFKKTHTSIYPCCWRLFVCLTGIYIYKALRHSHSMIRSFFKGTAQKTRRRRTTTIVFHTKHFFSKRSIPIIIYFSAASHSWHSFFISFLIKAFQLCIFPNFFQNKITRKIIILNVTKTFSLGKTLI